MMLTATAELDLALDRVVVDTAFRCKDAIKSVPGARWDTTLRKWTTPVSWPACLAMRAEFGKGLTIGDELRSWAMGEAERRDNVAEIRNLLELPDGEFPPLPGCEELLPFQEVDARLIAEAGGSWLNLNETGTGKTRSVAAGLALMEHEGINIFPVVVVAPKSVVINWQRELEPMFPGKDIRVCQGTPAKMRKALEPGGDFYLIGWDALRTYSKLAPFGSVKLTEAQKIPKELNELGFHTAVFDEVHRAKEPKSARTRAAWAVAETAAFRIGLTGTPIQETVEDMYGVLHLLFPKEYPTKTSYVDRYLAIEWNMWGGREINGFKPSRRDEFFRSFDTMHRRLNKKLVLPQLPDKIQEDRWVSLPPKLAKAYKEMKDTYRTELETSTMASENAMVAAGRLVQLANAWGDMDADGKFKMAMPSPKIEAFLEDVEEGDYAGSQVVVFSDSRELLDLLALEMTKKKLAYVAIHGDVTGADRQTAIDTFQAGDVQFCLLTRAGGEGITLTAADTMVRLVRPWSYTVHTQVEDRVHRIGSEIHDVVVYRDYLTADTIEIGQRKRLITKGAAAQDVLRDDELLEMLK